MRSILSANGELRRMGALVAFALIWSAAGCYGGLDLDATGGDDPDGSQSDSDSDSAGESGDGGEPGDGAVPEPSCADPEEAVRMPMRRLTAAEYDNTVRALLGVDWSPASAFPPDEVGGGYASNTTGSVSELHVHAFHAAAMEIAAWAVSRLDTLAPCDAASGERACAEDFVVSFGARAYRRPLSQQEVDGLLAVYDEGGSFATGIRLMLEAILQSPFFLYRIEQGVADPDTPGLRRLTSHEIATRMSYLLWQSMPDDALFAAATAGTLTDPDERQMHAERMLDDERARGASVAFAEQWLLLQALDVVPKSPDVYPGFEDVRESMGVETGLFVDYVMRHPDLGLQDLLTADFTFVDDALRTLYGPLQPLELDAGSRGFTLPEGFEPVSFETGRRAGVLTQASVLSTHALAVNSDPIRRGALVRTQWLCDTLPPPPAGIPEPEPPEPGASRRDELERHREDPACSGCHDLIDPIGFALERYDGMGAYRSEIGGEPIDDLGHLTATDVDGEVQGALELAQRLAQSSDVRDCFVSQYFRFYAGREESVADDCAMTGLRRDFETTGGNIRTLIVGLVTSESFVTIGDDS